MTRIWEGMAVVCSVRFGQSEMWLSLSTSFFRRSLDHPLSHGAYAHMKSISKWEVLGCRHESPITSQVLPT